ncbi:hypothetical protein FPZ54_08975 [Sphingomonas suaedae]|uniref:EF-hand domain-containing protein n=1 Tax=Sphingomonas suaedae TaxID=2599297 RepID=A0A518RFC1_9SPHN|nr:EF-hand domain-containing protein [Sphingomonas suaedae]QDX26141.1 hypothetical protein FPZ54_08975 [Sphingomonas suaedae]
MKTAASVAAIVTVCAGGLAFAALTQQAEDREAPPILLEPLRPGVVLEQYVAQLLSGLRQADREGDGLDRDDIKLTRALAQAHSRATSVAEVLRHDLDGNLEVTRSEIEQVMTREDNASLTNQIDRLLNRFDANSDGKVTVAEAAALNRFSDVHHQLDGMLELDPDGDGKLTPRELRELAERAFAKVDTDGDQKISSDEYSVIAPRVREAQLARSAPSCALPALPGDAKLIAVGAYEGDAISSAVIGGQDEETNIIDVAIEPGSQPLYLVLTSYESMVWRFAGATSRVARVVVTSLGSKAGISASGVVGIPARQVTIGDPDCPRYFYKPDSQSTVVAATLRRALGRSPDRIFGSYSVQRVSLPSGEIARAESGSVPPPRGFDAQMWSEAARYWPGGLVAINPRSVVAKGSVEPYKVLPSQMGLSQLLGLGAIERTSTGAFKIVRPIAHMPPSMGGGHSVTLIVAKGVPVPPGDPGHSCIVLESSGQSRGAACRRLE